MDDLNKLLNDIKSTSILVVGDCILDIYHHGIQSRDSVENPGMKVFDVTKTQYMPGGAANVAINCAALGADTCLVGAAGMDNEGTILSSLMMENQERSILSSNIYGSLGPSWRTLTKVRYFNEEAIQFRADLESHDRKIDAVTVDEICRRIRILVSKNRYDLIVVADYDKGTVSPEVYQECTKPGIPIVVDPKGRNFGKYKPCYVIKPNRLEAEQATGGRDLFFAVQEVKRITGASVVATDGDSGALCLDGEGDPFRVPVNSVIKSHVIGAGDSTLAGLACAISTGLSLRPATQFAMAAGASAVDRFGTTTVTPEMIQEYASSLSEFSLQP